MKTKRENKTKMFLMAIGFVGLMVASSCTKDSQECLSQGYASSGKDCEEALDDDFYRNMPPIAIGETEVSKEKHLSVADSTVAVAKLPVRVETNE